MQAPLPGDPSNKGHLTASDARDVLLDAPLRNLVDQLIAVWRAEQVWLFGSRARGDAQPESDWDLLVVVPDDVAEEEIAPLVAWRIRKAAGVRADVLPCRVSDFRSDQDTPNTVVYEVAREGVLLYER